jgi:hypothetical protein
LLFAAWDLRPAARLAATGVRPELDLDQPLLVGAVGEQTVAAAAFDGERFLVAWRSSLWKPELRVGRLTPAGVVRSRAVCP